MPEEGTVAAFELIGVDGVVERFSLTAADACALLEAAVAASTKQGLAWCAAGVTVTPKPDFVALVKKSRALAAATSAADTSSADAES